MTTPKPERLSRRQICKIADDFRAEHTITPNEIPVPVEEIAELRLKLDLIPVRGLRSHAGIEGILTNNRTAIYVDNGRYEGVVSRYRFTLAHELGHYVLHKDVYNAIEFKDILDIQEFINKLDSEDLGWFEWQAHEFAGRLLVPVNILEQKIENLRDHINELRDKYKQTSDLEHFILDHMSRKICVDFDVSHDVIEKRIKFENLTERLGKVT